MWACVMTICLTWRLCFADERENIVDVVARIDHHGFTGDFVPDDGAIALQRPNGKDFVNHGRLVADQVRLESSAESLRVGGPDGLRIRRLRSGLAAGVFAGAAGCELLGAGFKPCSTELGAAPRAKPKSRA